MQFGITLTVGNFKNLHQQTRLTILKSASKNRKFLKDQFIGKAAATAASKFIPYKPNPSPRTNVVAIDGSNAVANKLGFTFSVASVVAVTKNGEIKFVEDISGFDLNINSMRMVLEAKCVLATHKKFHTICDGSIYNLVQLPQSNKYMQRISSSTEFDLVFVAKTSTSRRYAFGPFTDMMYFSFCLNETGYSEPFVDNISPTKVITSCYVRLSPYCPIIKIEILGKVTAQKIEKIMDWLSSSAVNGYPYELQLAHDTCKITGDDLLEIESMIGITSISNHREILRDG